MNCSIFHARCPYLPLTAAAFTPVAAAAGVPLTSPLLESCLHALRLCFAAFVNVDSALHMTLYVLAGGGLVYATYRRLGSWRRVQPKAAWRH